MPLMTIVDIETGEIATAEIATFLAYFPPEDRPNIAAFVKQTNAVGEPISLDSRTFAALAALATPEPFAIDEGGF